MIPCAILEHQNIAKKGQKLILVVFKKGIRSHLTLISNKSEYYKNQKSVKQSDLRLSLN